MVRVVGLVSAILHLASVVLAITVQDGSQLISDPLTYGPELQLVHLYNDEFPTGTWRARHSN
jgi:hypothetical protein